MFRPDKAEPYEPAGSVLHVLALVSKRACVWHRAWRKGASYGKSAKFPTVRRDMLVVYGDGLESHMALKGRAETRA